MQTRPSKSVLGYVAALMLMAASASQAAPITYVSNGGFETGDFSGWTQFGDTTFTGVDSSGPNSGTFAAYFGNIASGGISQNIGTAVGALYTIDFWLHNEVDVTSAATPNSFDFSWDGVTQLSLSDVTLPSYVHYTYTLQATAATTALAFTFTNAPAFWDLDDVSVIPEPGTLAMVLFAGSLGAVQLRRSRRI